MQKSYRAARMQRHHKRFGSSALNLVSLMDIFTILVFFLLVNSSSAIQLPSSKAIQLPDSNAQQLPKETIIVLVNNEQILVKGKVIANVKPVLASKENTIPALMREMKFQAQQTEALNNELQVESEDDKDEGLEVTVMGDKQIPYKLLRKILATLSESNYTNISMAVMKRAEESKAEQS